jgi:thymidine phosphorylase
METERGEAAALQPQECIRRKRDGRELAADEIAFLVEGITGGSLSDAQVGALAMAIFFQGLSPAECERLTTAMADSGTRLRWDLDRPVVDKHSTGGVGDKVSLVLAPLLAACGAAVPMVSGRSLGHTGGTLDKLGAIPGYDATPPVERFRAVVREAGCAIVGQSAELAPADRRLYAVRDVTATVESTGLITASILSKKLAAGIERLVLDVKAGSGAFVPDLAGARALAGSLAEVGGRAGMSVSALVTDMNQVLGRSAGNAVEVLEAVDFLAGAAADERLRELVLALSGEMLLLAGLECDLASARRRALAALASGAAAERFEKMVAALGGPPRFVSEARRHLPAAPLQAAVAPSEPGYVVAVDVRAVGLAILELGGGRRVESGAIDPAVGLTEVAALGEAVGPERPLALCHARDERAAAAAAARLRRAFALGPRPVPAGPLVLERFACTRMPCSRSAPMV